MQVAEIQAHNKVNYDKLTLEEYRELLNAVQAYGYDVPYMLMTKLKDARMYMIVFYCDNGTIIYNFFTRRNRLQRIIKNVQAEYKNIKARLILEVLHVG
jgi:hypothetical protein